MGNKGRKINTNRLLLFEPNPSDNGIFNNEDFNIIVELETTPRSRNIISVDGSGLGTLTTLENNTRKIKFIGGTKLKNGETNLTTSWTEGGFNIDPNDENRDKESLGIKSIDISFGADYVPIVKIDFIDVRGNSIFQQGNNSKYSVFFNLPYPIFTLTIKGFYGKPVKYCLHLIKWNSKFNSQTGSFEIQTEFIGYTYAILSDILLGLMKSVIYTNEGKSVWEEMVEDFAKEGIELKSINQFNKDIQRLASEFQKIKNDDVNIKKLDSSVKTRELISTIKDYLDNLLLLLTRDGSVGVYSNSGLVITGRNLKESNKNEIESFKKNKYIKIYEEYNKQLPDKTLSINITDVNIDDYLINFDFNIPKDGDIIDIEELKLRLGRLRYYDNTTDVGVNDIENLSHLISNIYNENKLPSDDVIIYDFRKFYKEIDNLKDRLIEYEKKIRVEMGKELANKSRLVIGYTPTIRNIFLMLTAHAEAFMETLRRVSIKAEKNENRKNILKRLIGSGNSIKNRSDLKNLDVIYSWFEYREKSGNSDTYEEEWLGNIENGDQIDEVIFVEDLLKQLVNITKDEQKILEEKNFSPIPQYYPISVLDNVLTSNYKILNNPYYNALKGANTKTTPDEAIRCFLYRTFLFLSLSNVSYDKDVDGNIKNVNVIPKHVYKTMARLEAHNLFDVINKFDKIIKFGFISSIEEYTTEIIIDKWLNNKNIVVGKGVNRPFFIEDGEYYKYNYIVDGIKDNNNRAYIPIFGKFDGVDFYEQGTNLLKNISDIYELSNEIVYTNNSINNQKHSTNNSDDGSIMFKIINKNLYENYFINPEYGNSVLDKYKEKIFNSNIVKYIPQTPLKKFSFVRNGENDSIPGLSTFTNGDTNSRYLTSEITHIIYDDNDKENEGNAKILNNDKLADVLSSYYYNKIIGVNRFSGLFKFNNDNTFKKKYWVDINDKNKQYNLIKKFISFEEQYEVETSIKNDNVKINENKISDHLIIGKQRELLGSLLLNEPNIYQPYINYSSHNRKMSLFGSRFYYNQDNIYSRCFLFLHTYAFNGLSGDLYDRISGSKSKNSSLFLRNVDNLSTQIISDWYNDIDTYTTLGLFSNFSSFIKAPKLWVAFIGGLLYRYYENPLMIKFKDLNGNSLISNENIGEPDKKQFLYYGFDSKDEFVSMDFNGLSGDEYIWIEDSLINLPIQVRYEFINYFKEFSNNEFNEIRKYFELYYDEDNLSFNENDWENVWGEFLNKDAISYNEIEGIFNNNNFNVETLKTYSHISNQQEFEYDVIGNNKNPLSFILEIRPNSEGSNRLIDLLKSYVYIGNGNPHAFRSKLSNSFEYDEYFDLKIKKDVFNDYVSNFLSEFKILAKKYKENLKSENDKILKKIFNTIDSDFIKLQIYRTLSSIKNKWLSSATGENVFTQCSVNPQDIEISNYFGRSKPRLIDSFRFVDRAFEDIGDDFFINPIYVQELLLSNPNETLFNIINRILRDNNFTFIALPTFINYSDLDSVKDVFKPITYLDSTNIESGPSFVCTYVGQGSTNLDLGEISEYNDDGIIIEVDNNGNIINVPDDFIKELDDKKRVRSLKSIPYFMISYARQNQSIFKDISLDQSEFTETMESLIITEDISQMGNKRKPLFKGQNLFNVYQKRSYTAEVSMMGNPMIQPMMYFQLDDIPMFRGGYLIYKVNHHIKPNTMTTVFKGVRVKKVKTKLITENELFMNLLDTFENLSDDKTITTNEKIDVSINKNNKGIIL